MRRFFLPIVATVALCAGSIALGASPAAAITRATIAGSKPAWAAPATKVSDANASDRMQFRVYLKLRDQAGAALTAQAVSDPTSAAFRSYLSADQVRNRFAPTARSVAQVSDWLASQGMAPGYVPSNRLFVEATGSVAQVEQAFGVDLSIYSVGGQQVRGPDRDLSVPARLAPLVTGVVGTDQALSLMKPNHIGPDPVEAPAGSSNLRGKAPVTGPNPPPPDGFRNSPPCGAYFGEKIDTTDPAFGTFPSPMAYAPCGYKPPQLRAAYGTQTLVDQGLDGRGTTVAIIDAFASPNIYNDASTYAQRNDPGHPLTRAQFSQFVYPINHDLEGPDECDATGWWGEETLDVEAVHGMAPGANILYVGGSDCQDISLDKALNDVIAHQAAQIISNSYGNLGEDIAPAEVQIFQDIAIQGVLQGIGVYFSSGDSGDEVADLGFPSPDFSASSPWVTAVGGTSLGIGQFGEKLFETGWETGKSTLTDGAYVPAAPGAFLYGSGGGTSRLFAQPFYQRGVVPDSLAKKNQTRGNKGRVVPDISMVGDPNTGMLIGITQTFPEGVHYDQYRIGGTSLSSPLMAGVVALSDDLLNVRHGFINPVLYHSLKGTAGITDVTHLKGAEVRVDFLNGIDAADGTTTSVRSFDLLGLKIATTRGYDNVTGLGVPNGMQFLFRL